MRINVPGIAPNIMQRVAEQQIKETQQELPIIKLVIVHKLSRIDIL